MLHTHELSDFTVLFLFILSAFALSSLSHSSSALSSVSFFHNHSTYYSESIHPLKYTHILSTTTSCKCEEKKNHRSNIYGSHECVAHFFPTSKGSVITRAKGELYTMNQNHLKGVKRARPL